MQSIHRYPTDDEAKKLIVEIGRRMYQKNFVAANDGNISCKVDDDIIWTTPTGVSKGFMSEDMMVKMRLDGTVLSQGERGPSSEVKMHLRIYNENPEVRGVCHAHPPISTSFAIAGIGLDKAIYPEALVNLGTVPCVHYEAPGSQGIPDSIAPYCRDYNALLLANHGAVANKCGRIAGGNMAGAHDKFVGALGTAAIKVCGLEMGRTGMSETDAKRLGVDYRTRLVTAQDHPSYYPDPAKLTIKLIYEARTRRLLGACVAGARGAVLRADIFAVAIHAGMSTDELGMVDLAYAPPFAGVWDAVHIAANAAK